ncbi:zinc ribbon domain-containing protein [Methanogenium sp. MK-MG]|uniref:zinc ribbon domain-containing protein n=1 Tax=Methanogenium sp. MK-MG TaxID=2599926 RepID=UPI0013EC9446|nr:zinc ribbon domain-containing protein [Methanogenium sp. MK-MG]KAF1078123.1 hypothetical protein MKMG_00988 [Methanogenium sp. MK-MG]
MFGDGDLTCIENLLKPAEIIIDSGTGISRRSYEERVRLWNEVRSNYSRFENRECGSFDKTLDLHFRSKFEASLLTLATSFRRNREDPVEANTFTEDELLLYELIERYHVLPSKKELMTVLLSGEGKGSEFLNVHYRYIDGMILDACKRPGAANPYLLHFLKSRWNKYDKRLQDVVTSAIENNGLRWFVTFIGDGNKRAEQIVYNISGGSVNLGNGVQVVDSILSRAGITNENASDSIFPSERKGSPGGVQVQDSVVNRSTFGDTGNGDARTKSSERFCAACGTRLPDGAQFCTDCGNRVEFE